MRTGIVTGALFPDYELTDHTVSDEVSAHAYDPVNRKVARIP